MQWYAIYWYVLNHGYCALVCSKLVSYVPLAIRLGCHILSHTMYQHIPGPILDFVLTVSGTGNLTHGMHFQPSFWCGNVTIGGAEVLEYHEFEPVVHSYAIVA